MTTFTESTVEDAALAWLESLGWNVAHGPDMAPDTPGAERGDYGAVVLERRLHDTLVRLNPSLPTEALDDAFRRLSHPDGPTLEARNRAFHRMLVDGVTVEHRTDDGAVRGAQARVIDFDTPTNNDWLAVNQFTVVENKHERRPDVVLFVNGLPLGVIELKNPADEDATIWTAWQQLQTYKAELPTLFSMNAALLVSDGVEARIGTLTAGREWFKPWRTTSGETLADPHMPQLQVMLEGVCTPGRFLALVRDFIVFEDDGSGALVKKMAGTLIELQDANTRAVFGNYISIYDIQRAVEDRATVPIYYESRLAKLSLDKSERPTIDPDFEDATEGEEVGRQEKLKTKWAQLEAIVGTEKRLKLIAQDIVAHFEQRLEALDGKAMVVCMSRRICVELYRELVRLRPGWYQEEDDTGQMKVVMTGSASDPPDWQPHIRTKPQREALAKRFRNPGDPLRLVLVRDMWLTGVDAPSLHTMYVDKPMRGHGLMQAIARVNRVFRDKPGGLVVDYLGLAHELKRALATYTESGGSGGTAFDQERAVEAMQEKYEVCCNLLHGFNRSEWISGAPAERLALLPAAQEHILAQENGKDRYLTAVRELSQAFALAVPHEAALRIRDEVAFFQAVRAVLAKRASGDTRPEEELDHAVRQIVSRAVASEGVLDIFSAAGLEKPDISVLSDEFLAEVRANVTIDWTLRENVRANLRRPVKRILRKHGYPPDRQERATRTVLEQAEVLSAGWAA